MLICFNIANSSLQKNWYLAPDPDPVLIPDPELAPSGSGSGSSGIFLDTELQLWLRY